MEPYDDVYSRIDLLLPSELHFFKSAVNFRWRKQGQRQDLRCLDVHIEYHIVTVDAPEINMYSLRSNSNYMNHARRNTTVISTCIPNAEIIDVVDV